MKTICLLFVSFVFLSVSYADDGVLRARQDIEKVNRDMEEFNRKMKEAWETRLKEVDDPSTAEAIKRFEERMKEINKNCAQPDGKDLQNVYQAMIKCACAHPTENVDAINEKIDAFADLLNRRPDLANQTVTIKGAFGNFMLDSGTVSHRLTVQKFKEEYHCTE